MGASAFISYNTCPVVCSIKIADLHSNCSPDWSDDSFDTSSAQTGVIPIKRASRYAVACCNRRKVNFATSADI